MSKTKAYVSHPIRGQTGKDATDEQMTENNKKAMSFSNALKKKFPAIDFYIPGEHDEFIMKAYRKGWLNEEQILEIDCEILRTCDVLVVFAPDAFISGGMKVEIDCAALYNIPIVFVWENNVGFKVEGMLNRILMDKLR